MGLTRSWQRPTTWNSAIDALDTRRLLEQFHGAVKNSVVKPALDGKLWIFQGCFPYIFFLDIDFWDFYGMIAMNHSQYAQTGGMFTCLLCVWHWCCCGCRCMAPKSWNGTWNCGTFALVGLQDWFRYGAYIGFFNPMGSFGFLFAGA